jgi:hypothetical protein
VRSLKIPEYALADLFREQRIAERVESGEVTERLESTSVTAARLCSDTYSESYYLRLFDTAGAMVGRVHCIWCPLAGVVARWPSAILVGGITYFRVGHQPRPPS